MGRAVWESADYPGGGRDLFSSLVFMEEGVIQIFWPDRSPRLFRSPPPVALYLQVSGHLQLVPSCFPSAFRLSVKIDSISPLFSLFILVVVFFFSLIFPCLSPLPELNFTCQSPMSKVNLLNPLPPRAATTKLGGPQLSLPWSQPSRKLPRVSPPLLCQYPSLPASERTSMPVTNYFLRKAINKSPPSVFFFPPYPRIPSIGTKQTTTPVLARVEAYRAIQGASPIPSRFPKWSSNLFLTRGDLMPKARLHPSKGLLGLFPFPRRPQFFFSFLHFSLNSPPGFRSHTGHPPSSQA